MVLQPIAPTRTVTGRVVDLQGHPVSGAVVLQSGDGPAPTRSVTDASGRFRLTGVYGEPAFLFVDGDGLRFDGHPTQPQDNPIELLARHVGDPVGPPFHTLPPVLPRDQEKALARRMIQTDLATLLTRKDNPNETMLLIRILAPLDRVRARRLAETLESPLYQAQALGSMARGLANSDAKAAAALIDEAFDRLIKLVENGGYEHSAEPCLTAAEILPMAEPLDAELLRRCFWKTIALRPLRPVGSDPSFAYEQAVSSLAITLARYDRAVARQVLEPAARQVRSLDYGRRSWARNLFAAATVIDPAWAVSAADSLPDDRPDADLHPKASMQRVIADVLAHGGPDRWEQFTRAQVGYYLSSGPRDSKDDER